MINVNFFSYWCSFHNVKKHLKNSITMCTKFESKIVRPNKISHKNRIKIFCQLQSGAKDNTLLTPKNEDKILKNCLRII